MTVTVDDIISANVFGDSNVISGKVITVNETISANAFTGDTVTQFPAGAGFEEDAFTNGFNIG
jgi:hypothetical protein